MLRFVLLYHDCPAHYERPSHWDLMLESGDVLRTWALATLPRDWSAIVRRTMERSSRCAACAETNEVEAEQLGDHRREYLRIEGPVSGDRGDVTRVEEGCFAVRRESRDQWQVHITGSALQGIVQLNRREPGRGKWELCYEPDDPSG